MENEIDEICGMHGTRREAHKGFWHESMKERSHLEDLEIKKAMILKSM